MPDQPGSALRFPQVIDNTMRADFVLCPHRWFRRHCQGLVPATAGTSIHLHFGGCFARGLQVTRESYYGGCSSSDSIISGCRAALIAWGDDVAEPRTQSESLKTLPALMDALASYFEHYPLDRDPLRILDLGFGPLIEKSFAVPIPGTGHPDTDEPILYAGRCDMVAEAEGGIWIVDEKTSSRLGDSWAEKWDMDGQPTGYVWGFRSFGINPIGAIMRGVGIYSRGIGFSESLQPRPQWKVDQWLRQLCRDVERMCQMYVDYVQLRIVEKEQWHDAAHGTYFPGPCPECQEGKAPTQDAEGIFPRALDDACHAYNKPCPYKPLCNSPSPERWLGEYTVDYWEPLTLGDEA